MARGNRPAPDGRNEARKEAVNHRLYFFALPTGAGSRDTPSPGRDPDGGSGSCQGEQCGGIGSFAVQGALFDAPGRLEYWSDRNRDSR